MRIWLHKCFDKSYTDYRDDLTEKAKAKRQTPKQVQAVVDESMAILQGFDPHSRG